MKYWKKSNGECGTVDDGGYVPDSIEISKAEYDESTAVIKCESVSEQKLEYKMLKTTDEKLSYIAKMLNVDD